MKKTLLAATLAVMLCTLTTAHAQEAGANAPQGRHGFIIGFGVGPGYTQVKQSISFGGDDFSGSIDKFAGNTNFKIGFTAGRQILLYWSSRVAWFGDEVASVYYNYYTGTYYMVSKDATFASGVAGLGFSYYFSPSLPSAYLTGTLGYSSFGAPFNRNYDTEYGVGAVIGLGYEFAPHWTIEGVMSYGHTSKDAVATNVLSFEASLNVLSF